MFAEHFHKIKLEPQVIYSCFWQPNKFQIANEAVNRYEQLCVYVIMLFTIEVEWTMLLFNSRNQMLSQLIFTWMHTENSSFDKDDGVCYKILLMKFYELFTLAAKTTHVEIIVAISTMIYLFILVCYHFLSFCCCWRQYIELTLIHCRHKSVTVLKNRKKEKKIEKISLLSAVRCCRRTMKKLSTRIMFMEWMNITKLVIRRINIWMCNFSTWRTD